MKPRFATLAGASAFIALLTGCSPAESPADATRTPTPAAASPTQAATPTPSPQTATPPDESAADTVIGTVVRFSSDRTAVDVTIDQDSPAVRDFLSMLPLTLSLEEFSGREKVAYLPRELVYAGTPGSDPEDGDVIYYAPWGNLGFYYNAAGIGHSEDVLHIGTYDANLDRLDLLEGDVTVEVAESFEVDAVR